MSKILKVVGASWLQTKISSYILALLGLISILSLILGQIERIQGDGNYAATVFFSEKTGYRIELWGQGNDLADIARGVARAYLREDRDTNGWIILEVETDASYPDKVQAYAAGLVEGTLTWSLIHTHLENTIRAECEGREKQCEKLRDALDKSVHKWKSYAEEHDVDPFWHQVSLYYSQMAGIYTGWEYGVRRNEKEYKTDVSDLYWLNSISEVTELQRKLNISVEDETFNSLPGLSSAYLRIVNETSKDGLPLREMYVAQNGAGSYTSMIRLMKRYKLNYHMTSKDTSPIRGTLVDFSSYPGSITSQDEFYIVQGDNHKMAVTGTKLRNYNNKLWKDVNITDQVPIGPRITAANHLATNISSYAHTLARSNSGTACKQWLVVDYTKLDGVFTGGEKPAVERKEVITETMFNDTKHTVVHRASSGRVKGLVGLIEQIPGRTHSADISDAFVENTYWATHGLPFFKDIAEATHVSKMQEVYGNMFSESLSPRAEIFQREYKNATTLDGILKLMRSNDIVAVNTTSDDDCKEEMCLLLRGYWSVLGVRGDIIEPKKKAYGVIDTKVVKATWNDTTLNIVAVSGPPHNAISKEDMLVNKGNVASTYTDQFDDVTISGLEIRALVKQQKEEAEIESLKQLNKFTVKPFKWSESSFQGKSHERLPDLWDFDPFHPKWSW
ncbi:putative phospholipase B-like lamina ancestor [Aricia agestis]|uniref:putative phospholipase B-like lamina ancestor n=1 Tax=Aricia agestis TaxID=91739 RepID=UPI001C2041AB|nr:putative phospholipase B-like lamina ancestor [Aricia agestis]XP_041978903.1 putative phospholipase B-like lamina ancestor [Aricia agestis]